MSMTDLFPEIEIYWHSDLNGDISPSSFKPSSNFHFWWKCDKSDCEHEHIWEAPPERVVKSLEKNGTPGCPFCSGYNYCVCNSLLGKFPEICEEWDYEKNGEVTPDKVAQFSNKKAWWICKDCNHSFQRIISEAHRYGCPCCAGLVVNSDGSNSLEFLHPEVAKEWHPDKNGNLTAEQVTIGSGNKPWWKCHTCEHEWKTQVNVKIKHGCPYCKAGRLHSDGRNSLLKLAPNLVEEFHPDELFRIDPKKETLGSKKRVNWICKDCNHEWNTIISSRALNKTECPSCDGQAVHSDGSNSMASTHPELAKEFHPKKNGDLTPDNLKAGTNRRIWWRCQTCQNEWKVAGGSRLHQPTGKTTGCPYCSRGNLHSDGRNSMRNSNERLTKEFHPYKNGNFTPDNIIASSNKRIWWKCIDCEHEWRALADSRHLNELGCPCCAGQVLHSEGKNSMRNTHPEIAADFHPTKNGNRTPDNMMLGTQKSLWWKCSECENEWRATGTGRKGGSGCPTCNRGNLHSDRRNSVLNVNPELAKEFHSDKNGKLTANDITIGSGRKVWWKCQDEECGHSWRSAVSNRRRTGCPKCVKVGFQVDKPAYYYVIKIMNKDRILCWKGGISSDYHRRIRQHRNLLSQSRFSKYKLELHETIHFEIGEEALILENELLRTFDIRAPDMEDFSFELFIQNPLDFARSVGLVN